MSKDHIRYDLLVQNALKGVVRKVLADAGRDGLPSDHHFYVSFRTDAPKVRVSSRLKDRYPEEMTIVLQHQFWDLAVSDSQFEVGLSFGGVPERLVVPFDAVTGFYDPSVEFGLKFEVKDDAEATQDDDDGTSGPEPRPFTPRPLRERTPGAGDAAADEPAASPEQSHDAGGAAAASGEERGAESATGGGDEAPAGGAQVVSLDAFRKKL